MAKPKPNARVNLGGVTYSEEELRAMFREAKRRGREYLQRHPVATSVRYEPRRRRVILTLSNCSEFSVPVDLLQGLSNATPAQLKDVVILPVGTAIEWTGVDQQFSVSGLLAGVFGTKSWMRELHRKNLPGIGTPPNKSEQAGVRTKRRSANTSVTA